MVTTGAEEDETTCDAVPTLAEDGVVEPILPVGTMPDDVAPDGIPELLSGGTAVGILADGAPLSEGLAL